MDLDTSKPALFWKDFAATELNVAIITSFQVNLTSISNQRCCFQTLFCECSLNFYFTKNMSWIYQLYNILIPVAHL